MGTAEACVRQITEIVGITLHLNAYLIHFVSSQHTGIPVSVLRIYQEAGLVDSLVLVIRRRV